MQSTFKTIQELPTEVDILSSSPDTISKVNALKAINSFHDPTNDIQLITLDRLCQNAIKMQTMYPCLKQSRTAFHKTATIYLIGRE